MKKIAGLTLAVSEPAIQKPKTSHEVAAETSKTAKQYFKSVEAKVNSILDKEQSNPNGFFKNLEISEARIQSNFCNLQVHLQNNYYDELYSDNSVAVIVKHYVEEWLIEFTKKYLESFEKEDWKIFDNDVHLKTPIWYILTEHQVDPFLPENIIISYLRIHYPKFMKQVEQFDAKDVKDIIGCWQNHHKIQWYIESAKKLKETTDK